MVDDDHVADVPGDGKPSIDIIAHDELETEAKKIDAPVASRTPLDPSVSPFLHLEKRGRLMLTACAGGELSDMDMDVC